MANNSRYSHAGLLPVTLTPLQPSLEFMEAGDAIRMLRSNRYFTDSSDNNWHTEGDDSWPTALKLSADIPLATSALGALVSHLTRMKVHLSIYMRRVDSLMFRSD